MWDGGEDAEEYLEQSSRQYRQHYQIFLWKQGLVAYDIHLLVRAQFHELMTPNKFISLISVLKCEYYNITIICFCETFIM